MEESSRYCKVCVTGGSGFIGSSLICKLLNKGVYYVHATLRNLGDTSKVSLLKELPGAEARLQLFEADIYNPDQFEAAIKDCQYVFHLATPFTHLQHSQYKDLREAAVAGTKSIIMACKRSGTVRRLIYTASVVASSALNEDHSAGLKDFLDENCWTPLHHHVVTSSVYKDYIISKTESEKEALRYEDDGNLEVVALACGLVGGETVLSYAPLSLINLVSQMTDNCQTLRLLEELLGKIPILHIEDTCDAHIFCIRKDSLHGRFLCASEFVSSSEIAGCLQQICPEIHVNRKYLDEPKKNVKWASTKLIEQGFKYKYDMKMIVDDSSAVSCFFRARSENKIKGP